MDPLNWVLNLNTFRGDAISLDPRPNTLSPAFYGNSIVEVEVSKRHYFFFLLVSFVNAKHFIRSIFIIGNIFVVQSVDAETHHCCLLYDSVRQW